MQQQPKKPWFKARRFGWGWTPITWQGWTAFGVMFLVIAIGAANLTIRTSHLTPGGTSAQTYEKDYLALVIADVLAFILLCYRKGEQPHWHWGTRDRNLHNEISEHNDHD